MVANAVSKTNLLISGGNIKTDNEDYLIRARNRNYYGNELLNIVVRADAGGNIIRLKDIADVDRNDTSYEAGIFEFNGKEIASYALTLNWN